MLRWLWKNIFGSEEPSLYTKSENEGRIGIDKPKVTPTIKEEADTKPAQAKQEQPKKRGRKKAGITKTDLNKMTKDELEAYAKKEHKVDLDKRKKKADLVEEVLKLAK